MLQWLRYLQNQFNLLLFGWHSKQVHEALAIHLCLCFCFSFSFLELFVLLRKETWQIDKAAWNAAHLSFDGAFKRRDWPSFEAKECFLLLLH